jgi:hypothetical protein
MIYLKRFLYILIIIIMYTLIMPINILYIVFIPIGLIISFILTGNMTRYFNLWTKLKKYITFVDDKLDYIFLK